MPNHEYISFMERIAKAKDSVDIRQLEKALDGLYNAQVLTTKEYTKLDLHLMKLSTQFKEAL